MNLPIQKEIFTLYSLEIIVSSICVNEELLKNVNPKNRTSHPSINLSTSGMPSGLDSE